MKLEKPISFFDIEGTGPDPAVDRIIEIAVVTYRTDGTRRNFVQRFNPGIPIPPASTEVHHITDTDVASCPPFSDYANRIADSIAGKDLGGYNLRLYDLVILDEELRRCGRKLDLRGVRVIDTFGIFANKEPRKLEDAVRRYCGREHEGAHGALADADATLDVFLGQIKAYDDLAKMDLQQISDYSRRNPDRKDADLAGKLYYDKENRLRFAFGKWREQPVDEHMDYAMWMINKGNFPGSTIETLEAFLNEGSFRQEEPAVADDGVPF